MAEMKDTGMEIVL